MDRDLLAKKLFTQNKSAIAKVLTQNGIDSVYVQYSGSGDCGNGNQASVPAAISEIEVQRFEIEKERVDGKWIRKSSEGLAVNLKNALEALCDDAIESSGNSGYETDAGGGGKMTLYSDGRVVLDHYYIIEKQLESSYEL